MTHRTLNDIPDGTRAKIILLLQARLFDLLDLQSQVKVAHWNVKGPSFMPLHELFDSIAGQSGGHIDDVAERLVQLGGVAAGTVRDAARGSTLSEAANDTVTGLDHARNVTRLVSAAAKSVRAAIDTATEAGDAGTADLLTGISRDLDKQLWFVEAHLQTDH
jgi:starvation-inducible DNA-binding protein